MTAFHMAAEQARGLVASGDYALWLTLPGWDRSLRVDDIGAERWDGYSVVRCECGPVMVASDHRYFVAAVQDR